MFVIWGALHGGGLALERLIDEWRGKPSRPQGSMALLRGLLTFHFVCLAWIFFRAPSMEVVGEILSGIFAGWDALPGVETTVYCALGLGLVSQFMPKSWLIAIEDNFARRSVWIQGFLLGLALLLIDALAPPGVAAFIYFQF